MKKRFLPVLLLSALCLCTAKAQGSNLRIPEKKWSAAAYTGIFTPRSFGHTLWRSPAGKTESKYLQAFSVSRRLSGLENKYLSTEIEGIAAHHWGKHKQGRQSYQEFAASLNLRYHWFPWDRYINTSLAVGQGISFTSEAPMREKQKDGESQRWLNYLLVELAFENPFSENWDIFYRIHHRSGVLKIFSNGGSNFYCLGIRYRFSP